MTMAVLLLKAQRESGRLALLLDRPLLRVRFSSRMKKAFSVSRGEELVLNEKRGFSEAQVLAIVQVVFVRRYTDEAKRKARRGYRTMQAMGLIWGATPLGRAALIHALEVVQEIELAAHTAAPAKKKREKLLPGQPSSAQILAMAEEANQEHFGGQIPMDVVSVSWAGRSSTRWGVCKMQARSGSNLAVAAQISLEQKQMAYEDFEPAIVYQTLVHELTHAWLGFTHSVDYGHGPLFQRKMRSIFGPGDYTLRKASEKGKKRRNDALPWKLICPEHGLVDSSARRKKGLYSHKGCDVYLKYTRENGGGCSCCSVSRV